MGLRLLSRDGRVVARLSRWALRCSACFFVTREAGRLFCPKCGNMSLDRVEVSVGPDGSEFFGVPKRHILRGTKFSLPKPRVRERAGAPSAAPAPALVGGRGGLLCVLGRRGPWGCVTVPYEGGARCRLTVVPPTSRPRPHPPRRTPNPVPGPQGGRNSRDPILREDVFLLKVKALGRKGAAKKAPPPPEAADPFAPAAEFGEGRSQAQLAQHRGLAAVLEPAWKRNPNERKLTRSNRRR
jgi:ribosomal protein S27AE